METVDENNSRDSKETAEEENLEIKNAPAIPTSFEESIEYPIIGQFAGVEFTDQDEIIEVLDLFPKLTSDSSKEELEQWKRYLWTLFKEDLKPVNVPIDQWDSMKFDNPTAGNKEFQLKENYNIALLLDSSGSMGNYENDRTRMDLAKEAIQQFVQDLPEKANISLYVYGHEGTGSDADKKKSCSTVEEVYPLSTYNNGEFTEALNQFEPAGWTPMAKAIELVTERFQKYDGKENTNVIYVVSDGVETCEGDPIAAIKSLADSNIEPVVNIIGYQVDNEGLTQLKEMADASQGRYINATSQADLVSEFEQTVDMSEIWSEWHKDSNETIEKLYNTINEQLNNWYNEQGILINREHTNLAKAVEYLQSKGIIGPNVFLDYNAEVANYFLDVNVDYSNLFLDLNSANANEFLDANGDISKRFLDSLGE
ncbi:VWA domain-containing protein [Virgibacillus sp. SK37]|uniref:vWA domain-containing protein n=1 Tax=Virgibacillus sp. SK37 TaxID=403957 RepID=UPI0011A53E98|nr:VWA domain-containing protein [Virgibacillus sp. SK37]